MGPTVSPRPHPLDELTFTVEVTHTDRTKVAGRFRAFTTSVEVLAPTDVDAVTVACQMVGAVRSAIGGMVIGARITDVTI